MGSYNGAEICELVGLHILSFLGKVYGIQNVGLYQDDGLACLHKIGGAASDKIRKDMIETFQKNFCLKITVTTILKTGNFLAITFNLCTRKYQPYKKPNDTPTYISANSNQLPNIIKALPNNISKRISNIWSDKATFNNAASSYNDVLSASGHKENLTNQQDLTPSKKVRQRKIIKDVKVSYSCSPNFANIIKPHNHRILSEEKTQDQPKFNCWQKDTCPLEGHCLDKELICWCILKENTTSDRVNYNSLTENTFKHRFINTAIPSSTKVRQILQNCLRIYGKWKEKASKNQSCIGQLLILLNHIRTGLKGTTYV